MVCELIIVYIFCPPQKRCPPAPGQLSEIASVYSYYGLRTRRGAIARWILRVLELRMRETRESRDWRDERYSTELSNIRASANSELIRDRLILQLCWYVCL